MPDPSLLVSVPTLERPGLAPHGSSVLYALEPVPNLRGGIDWERERDAAEATFRGAARRRSATRSTTSPSSGSSTRSTGPAPAMVGGTPFSLSHRFLQSGRSGRQRRAPGPRPGVRRLRHGARRRRAHGARCRAGWPPTGADAGDGPMIDTGRPRRTARPPTRAAGSCTRAPRHDVLLGHAAAARAQPPARLRALRLLPPRRRHRRRASTAVTVDGRADALARLGDQLRRRARRRAVDRAADPVRGGRRPHRRAPTASTPTASSGSCVR